MEPPVRLSETELKFACMKSPNKDQLNGVADGSSPSSVTLRVSNEWNAGLLFKVKTTNPDRYALSLSFLTI